MTRRAVLFLLLFTVLGGAGLFAQDASGEDASGQDVFDTSAFDQNVQQSKQEEQVNKLEYLFGGTFLLSNSLASTDEFGGYSAAGSFSGKAFVKVSVPRYAAAYLAYTFQHPLYAGASSTSSAFPGQYLDLFGNQFALSEFHLSFDIERAVFFRIGNQLLSWGATTIWNPVDFFNLQRPDPLASVDVRVGKPALRVLVPLGKSNVFLFGDFSGTVSGNGAVNDLVDTTNVGARWDVTALGFELALTGFFGKSIQNRYGVDFSGSILGFDTYGALALALPQDGYSFTYSYSLGASRVFGELKYWTIQGEFFYNDAGIEETARYPALLMAGSFTPFYLGKTYGYAGITNSHVFIDGISATLAGFMNLSDKSYVIRLSSSLDVPRLIPFTASVSYAGGGAGREFTYFTGDKSLTAALQVRFEF
jgi:hypothetical protein